MTAAPDFATILDHLRDTSRPFPPTSLYHLSDLGAAELAAVEAIWNDLPTERRHNLLQSLNDLGEANFEVNFESVFRLGLDDEDSGVRATAVRALWEAEDPALIAPFITFLQNDPDPLVRAAAASALGRFVYLGELEELTPAHQRRVEDALLEVISGADDVEVRRRALEAVSYSSRDEVPPLIAAAYESDEPKQRVSAIFSMGRNADRPRWSQQVRAELDSREPEMRFEAARAAGELELREAGPALGELLEDTDTQVREAAVWSLGQIGGDFARRTLTELLENTEDEEEQDFIQEALDNLAFTDEVNAFSLFELGQDEDDEPMFEFDDDDDDELGLLDEDEAAGDEESEEDA
jgi:HEAT repeat protein